MAHRNVIMRDPIMYRIVRDTPHPRTGSKWPIYPSYDWAHGLSDAIEEVTHSVCTLEFNMHNELYDWFNEQVKSMGGLECELPRQHDGRHNQRLLHAHGRHGRRRWEVARVLGHLLLEQSLPLLEHLEVRV